MQCTAPITLFKVGKQYYPQGLQVPCGKCLACRIKKRKEWQVKSFFPRGIDPQTEIIDDDYHTSDFSIGSVIRLKQDGVVFVAETNASPWTVYANLNNIEAWSK